MKKRILSILLTILLMFTMVGCNQETDSPSKNHSEKVEDDDDKHKDDKDEKETTTADKTEMTMEEKLLSDYWYFNAIEIFGCFFKVEFEEDGTFQVEYLPKSNNEELLEIYGEFGLLEGEWEYSAKRKELSIELPYTDEEFEFSFDESDGWFHISYELEDFFDLFGEEIPDEGELEEGFEEFYKFLEDGIDCYVFSSEHNYKNLDEETYDEFLSDFYDENDYSELYYELDMMEKSIELNVEKTRIQKDKSAIGELHHAIELSMAYIVGDVKVNPNPVKVNGNGEISIAELFDTSNAAGRNFVEEIEYCLDDDCITLESRMKNDCSIQIVKFDGYNGIVVIQVISEEADEKFYYDYWGQYYEGIYFVEEETEEPEKPVKPDHSEKPSVDNYGSGEIKIWVADNMVDLTEEYANAFLSAHPEYSGYTVVVEPVGEGDAPSNMINNLEYGADIYGFAQDQLAKLVLNGALHNINYTSYSDLIKQNNDASAVKAATYGDGMYGFPITSDNGYFMHYDKSVITDPTSLEAIISDCERAGKNIYFEVNSGWYQTAFFFGTGCELSYNTNSDGTFSDCNIDYDSEAGVVALKEMIDLVESPSFRNGSSAYQLDLSDNAAVVISGTWDKQSAIDLFGDNYAAAKLPEFTGCDGRTYQLSGFCGNKLLGVKPQTEEGKAIVCLDLAEYLSSEEVQLARYETMGWTPSNLYAQQSYSVQADIALSALLDQNQYAYPQGQYPGDYWSRATTLGDEILAGYYNNSSDSELRNVLAQFEADCESYADN